MIRLWDVSVTPNPKTMKLTYVGLLAVLLTSVAKAQTRPVAQRAGTTAGIQGDVYLVTQSGDTKKGAGRTIYLTKNTPLLQAQLARACAKFDSIAGPVKAEYHKYQVGEKSDFSAMSDLILKLDRLETEAVDSVRSALTSAARTTGTGMNARYSFTGLTAGEYVLFAEWSLGDKRYQYQFYTVVNVKAGQTVTKDLENSVEVDDKLYCGAY